MVSDQLKNSPGKPKMSLGLQVFLMSVGLIVLALLIVIGVTFKIGRDIADQSAVKNLQASAEVHSRLMDMQLRELALMTSSFTSDPNFVGYIADSLFTEDAGENAIDVGSVMDLMKERQEQTGLDFLILLDQEGELVLHSERPGLVEQNYQDNSLFQPTYEELVINTGFWIEEGRLYQAVAVPLDLDFELVGFVIAGIQIDRRLVDDLGQMGVAEIAFLLTDGKSPSVVASTIAADSLDGMLTELAGLPLWSPPFDSAVQTRLAFGGGEFRLEITPLLSAEPGSPQPLLLTRSSYDEFVEDYNRLLNTVLLAGLLVTVLALVFSYWISNRVLKPVTSLAAAAQAASAGDYNRALRWEGNDPLARLSQAFDNLLSDLRDKLDMQLFLSSIQDQLPELENLETTSPQTASPTLLTDQCSVLAIEVSSSEVLSRETIKSIVDRQCQIADNHNGEFLGWSGGVVSFVFFGPSSVVEAARALAGFSKSMAASQLQTRSALSYGPCTMALTVSGGNSHSVSFGQPFTQARRLMLESRPGVCLATKSVYEQLKPEFTTKGLELKGVSGVLSGKAFAGFAVSAGDKLDAAGTVIEDVDATMVMSEPRTVFQRQAPLFPERYEILATLGSGAMGIVYKAYDRELDSVVALKLLTIDFDNQPKMLEWMKREINLARKVTHQNVLRTYDLGDASGKPFISMEFVRGMSLDTLLKTKGKLPYSAGLKVAHQLCSGLASVHEIGVLHRDIKPANIILEPNGNVKLMDFGIACPVEEGGGSEEFFVGTPSYASPEQILGHKLDQRSDIYSLGMVLLEIFCGENPMKGQSYQQVHSFYSGQQQLDLSQFQGDLPEELYSILVRCLNVLVDDRVSTIEKLWDKLSRLRA